MSNATTVVYDCDAILSQYPPPPPPLSPTGKILSCTLIAVFSAATLFGNSFVILLVAKYKHLQLRTNAFIVSVAFADICVAVLVMPFRLYEEWNGSWQLGRWFCLSLNMFDAIFCTVSMSNLYCLGFERYMAICRPFLHQRINVKATAFMIGACWFFPIVGWMIPILNQWHVQGIERLVTCATDGACPFILNQPMTIVADVPGFFIPTLFIIYCYLNIFFTARKHMRAIADLNVTESQRKEIQKIKKTLKPATILGIVIGCFCVCWFPFFAVFIIDPFIDYQIPIKTKLIVIWIGYTNSMLNPILYYIFDKRFRLAYKAIFCFQNIRDDDQMPSFTNTNSVA